MTQQLTQFIMCHKLCRCLELEHSLNDQQVVTVCKVIKLL